MMTTVICTVCGDPVVITSREVALPFVCNRHSQEAPMAKKSNKSGTAAQQPAPETDNISNEMLLDMAAQLQKANDDLTACMDSKEFVNQLANRLQEDKEVLQDALNKSYDKQNALAKQAETLGKEKVEANKIIAKMFIALLQSDEEIRVRDVAGELACNELLAAKAEIERLGRLLRAKDDSLETSRKELRYTRDKMYKYETELAQTRFDFSRFKGSSIWNRLWPKD